MESWRIPFEQAFPNVPYYEVLHPPIVSSFVRPLTQRFALS